MKSRISLEIVIIFFITILVTSYVPTISESISSGGADLGLAPAKCLFNGINHYESFLSSDGRCEVERSHLGEYLQGYYVMLYPLTFLDWEANTTVYFCMARDNIIETTFDVFKRNWQNFMFLADGSLLIGKKRNTVVQFLESGKAKLGEKPSA